jgi:hypothetical protein
MDTEYLVNVKVRLTPVGRPWIKISAGNSVQSQQLINTTTFEFNFHVKNAGQIIVEHFDKSDLDPTTAVIIDSISFFNIEDPKFVLAGIYYPDYPKHYDNKIAQLFEQNYLGWNGRYILDFTVPVFTWMHKTQNLGWIYN